MDTCKIRPGVYQFTAIDDCSRYLVAGLARRRSAAATLTFLDQVLEEMPFSVQRVQTDRGTEFFAEEVQRRLMDETIRFRPIPARSPHLNGKVERAQRTCLEEFWAATDLKAVDIGDQLCSVGSSLQLAPLTRVSARRHPYRPSVPAGRQDAALGRSW